MNTSHKEARKAAAAERWAEALELRKCGHTYEYIANEIGYSSPGAARDAVMKGIREIVREPAEEVLALELARLDMMLIKALENAKTGDPQAIDAMIKIMARRAKYLGLDSPEKVITVEATSTPAQAAEVMRQLFGAVTPDEPSEPTPHDPEPQA